MRQILLEWQRKLNFLSFFLVFFFFWCTKSLLWRLNTRENELILSSWISLLKLKRRFSLECWHLWEKAIQSPVFPLACFRCLYSVLSFFYFSSKCLFRVRKRWCPFVLRIRLFALVTEEKGNATGVYAEIFMNVTTFCYWTFFYYYFYFFGLIFFLSFYIFRRLWAPAGGATTFNRGDFHFINLLHFFLLLCFQLLLIILFFLYLFFFYPRYLPTPTTSTHYPRNLATLGCVGEFCSGGRRFKGPE